MCVHVCCICLWACTCGCTCMHVYVGPSFLDYFPFLLLWQGLLLSWKLVDLAPLAGQWALDIHLSLSLIPQGLGLQACATTPSIFLKCGLRGSGFKFSCLHSKQQLSHHHSPGTVFLSQSWVLERQFAMLSWVGNSLANVLAKMSWESYEKLGLYILGEDFCKITWNP